MRGSVLAYSGSMGNAVRITHNHIYGNTAGISTDTISAAGHPGFPADSVQIDHNYIYSNNLELFKPNPPVEPVVGILPAGVGIFWAGHNNGRVYGNWIWDNWRNAAFLLSIPDFLVTPEGNVNPGGSCNNTTLSTSCGNRFFDNHLGRVPKGFKPFPALCKFGNNVGATRGRAQRRRLLVGRGRRRLGDRQLLVRQQRPRRHRGQRHRPRSRRRQRRAALRLPASISGGDPVKVAYLLSCFLAREGDAPPEECDWYTLPPKPGSRRPAASSGASTRAPATS